MVIRFVWKISGRDQHHNIRSGGVGVFIRVVFLAVELALAFPPPNVQVRFVSEDRALLTMGEAAYRQIRAFLPALDRPNIFLEVCRNLLPGVEALDRKSTRL